MISIINSYSGTKESLENNPSIINKVNNRYMNWQIIASMINHVKAGKILPECDINRSSR